MYFEKTFMHLKNIPLIIIILIVFIWEGCSNKTTGPEVDSNQLETVVPEDVGYSTAKLNEAKNYAPQSGYNAVIALYNGKILFSWGEVDKNYSVHSIWKPFVSALYGIHKERGEINLDLTIADLGIDDIAPVLTSEEKKATIRDLLKSRSGIYHEAAAETQEMKDMRPQRGSHPHNTFFYYNNWDFNVGGVIFEQLTGAKIFEDFKKEIADPIGMQDFDINQCFKNYELNVSNHPSWRFRMSARDLARFGALYQMNGVWNNKQIISPQWITESTTSYSVLDSASGVGYGYRWKVIPENSAFAQLIGSKGYFHTGVGVQIVLVLNDLDLVIVEMMDTDGNWVDPGDKGIELGLKIINSKIN